MPIQKTLTANLLNDFSLTSFFFFGIFHQWFDFENVASFVKPQTIAESSLFCFLRKQNELLGTSLTCLTKVHQIFKWNCFSGNEIWLIGSITPRKIILLSSPTALNFSFFLKSIKIINVKHKWWVYWTFGRCFNGFFMMIETLRLFATIFLSPASFHNWQLQRNFFAHILFYHTTWHIKMSITDNNFDFYQKFCTISFRSIFFKSIILAAGLVSNPIIVFLARFNWHFYTPRWHNYLSATSTITYIWFVFLFKGLFKIN